MNNQLVREGLEVTKAEGEEPPSTNGTPTSPEQKTGEQKTGEQKVNGNGHFALPTNGNRSEESGALKKAAEWVVDRLRGRNGDHHLRDTLEEIIGEFTTHSPLVSGLIHRQPDGSVQRLSINRYPLGEPYEPAWSGGDLDAQWKALGELLVERDPRRVGINVSEEWPVADGLTHGLHQKLLQVLPEDFHRRLVPAENLVVRWLETRSESERAVYPHIVSLARGVIGEAFSARVITPGVTTTGDVAWYIRERFEGLGLPIWFMPDVNLQRAGADCAVDAAFCGERGIIQPGDVLHTDVGICYLKLCTDTQEMGYVLRAGEHEVPAGLRDALATGNRWQDLLVANFATGRTGNEVLARTRADAARAGIASSTYSHPIGFFGHAPGPTIGMWDDQGGTPGRGDWPLHRNTAYAIEGNVKAQVPEWNGQHVQVKLEQSALFDGERVLYLAGRQTRWHVVE